jgi:hypothetical protein
MLYAVCYCGQHPLFIASTVRQSRFCHSERSEESYSGIKIFTAFRMTGCFQPLNNNFTTRINKRLIRNLLLTLLADEYKMKKEYVL